MDNEEISYKIMKPSEWEDIKDGVMYLEKKVFQEEIAESEEEVSARFLDKNSICIVAFDGDKVAGALYSGPLESFDYPGIPEDENFGKKNTVYIESTAVLPDYQNKRISLVD